MSLRHLNTLHASQSNDSLLADDGPEYVHQMPITVSSFYGGRCPWIGRHCCLYEIYTHTHKKRRVGRLHTLQTRRLTPEDGYFNLMNYRNLEGLKKEGKKKKKKKQETFEAFLHGESFS